jgi:aspartyl-tRNA(Asn)/glutamyl-tRNA(Gln) amidotransferase subunit A
MRSETHHGADAENRWVSQELNPSLSAGQEDDMTDGLMTGTLEGAASMRSLAADPGSIDEIGQAISSRRSDPGRLLESCLRRIDAVESLVQGWSLLDRDGAVVQVRTLQQELERGHRRGPLHGIPVAVKDVIDVAGLPTRAGSTTRADIAPSTIDAQVVAQLRAAGALVLGKAHTTEFAYFDGPPPTRNPHNLGHTPGGSSAGPAALVAAGMVLLSLGTQTAGSVNRPAAYCGIAAFKPSTRAWSSFGVVPFAPSFDTVGVFGYRVADATAAARALMPPYFRRHPAPVQAPSLPSICFVDDPILEAASAAVNETVRSAAEALADRELHVVRRPSAVPFADVIGWHRTMMEYEVARAHPALEQAAGVSDGLRDAIARGRSIRDAAYRDAWGALEDARDRFWAATSDIDMLIFPAAPGVAPAGMKTGDPRFIAPFTAFGGPIVSVPVGSDKTGLPLGLMLIAAPGRDVALADMAEHVATIIELPR